MQPTPPPRCLRSLCVPVSFSLFVVPHPVVPHRWLRAALSQFSLLIPIPPCEQLLTAAVGDSEVVVVVVVVVTVVVIVPGSGIVVSEL
jgi:hypothetical protein